MKTIFNHVENVNGRTISLGAFASSLFIILMPLSIGKVSSGASIMRYLSVFVALIYFVDLYAEKSKYSLYKENQGIYSFYFLYIIVSCMGLAWAVETSKALNTLIGLILTFGIYVFFTLRSYNKLEYFILKLSWVFVAIFIATVTIFFGVQSGYQRTTVALLGGMEDKNQLVGYFILPIIYLINWMMQKKILIPLLGGIVGYLTYSLLLTGSRGGVLALITAVISYILVTFKKNRIKTFLYLALILIIAYFAYDLFLPYLPKGIVQRMSITSIISDGGSDRNIIWENCINMLLNNPLRFFFGYGLSGSVKFVYEGFTHNHFLQVLFDDGLVGLILFSLFIRGTIKRALKLRALEFSALLGILMLSLTITTYTFFKPYWIILMMSIITVTDHQSTDRISQQTEFTLIGIRLNYSEKVALKQK